MTTNKAFIKAFRQDAAQTAPAKPALAGTAQRPALTRAPAQVANTLTATVEYIAAPNTAGLIVNQTSAPVGNWAAAFVDTTPAEKPAAASRRVADAPVQGRRVDPPNGGKRPLSSFTSQARPRPTPQPHPTGFEPGTKVANFNWPGVCRTLLRQHGPHYDRLADALLANTAKHSFVGVLGLFPGSGCTTTLLCLAARLSSRGRRVIIVDGNFAAPQLAQWLDVQTTAGWQDVLAHGAPVADAVVRATADNLDLLPLNSQTRNALELASGPQASRTADTLRTAYDLTLIDLGAFFNAQSQPTLLELVRNLRVDAAIAVAGPQAADPRDLATLAEYLREHRCELLGTIENRAQKMAGQVPPLND